MLWTNILKIFNLKLFFCLFLFMMIKYFSSLELIFQKTSFFLAISQSLMTEARRMLTMRQLNSVTACWKTSWSSWTAPQRSASARHPLASCEKTRSRIGRRVDNLICLGLARASNQGKRGDILVECPLKGREALRVKCRIPRCLRAGQAGEQNS